MESNQSARIISLNKNYFVTNGGRCLVYRHPENENLLIKVVNPKFRERNTYKVRLVKQVPTIDRYRLSKCYIRELVESVRLRFSNHYIPQNCIQHVVGLVDTNFGFGLVVRAERDKEGKYATTLKTLIQTNQFNEHAQQKLENFYQSLADCDVAVSDCSPPNVVYAYDDIEGEHFALIDGIGEKTLIPILRMSAYLRKKSRLRQIEKLKQRVASDLGPWLGLSESEAQHDDFVGLRSRSTQPTPINSLNLIATRLR